MREYLDSNKNPLLTEKEADTLREQLQSSQKNLLSVILSYGRHVKKLSSEDSQKKAQEKFDASLVDIAQAEAETSRETDVKIYKNNIQAEEDLYKTLKNQQNHNKKIQKLEEEIKEEEKKVTKDKTGALKLALKKDDLRQLYELSPLYNTQAKSAIATAEKSPGGIRMLSNVRNRIALEGQLEDQLNADDKNQKAPSRLGNFLDMTVSRFLNMGVFYKILSA